MAYKVANVYKDSHILELNMMGVSQYKKSRISTAEILMTITPLVIVGLIFAGSMIGDMAFFAECQNIPGGDICSISLK